MELLALDFGGKFVKYCLIDENLEISERGEFPAPLESADDFVQVIRNLYYEYDEVDGIAISMPGVIDADTGYLYSAGVYTPVIGKTNLFDKLGSIGVPVSVENDAKASVMAESYYGSLQGVRDAACIIIGRALGGGIVIDGRIRKGSHFASGEISAMLRTPGIYERSNLAARGASQSALLIRVAAAKGMSPAQFNVSSHIMKGEIDPNLPVYSLDDVFKWIDEGDQETCAAYAEWLKNLVQVIINLKMTIDPEKIVLGGKITNYPRLLQDVQAEYDKSLPVMNYFGFPETQLGICTYTADAHLVGAVANWMYHNSYAVDD